MSAEAKITRKLFKKYNLDVHEIHEQDFLGDSRLPGEIDCKEVRITLGEIRTLEWMKDWHDCDNLKDYNEEYTDKKTEYEKTAKAIKDTKQRKKWFDAQMIQLEKNRENFLNDLDHVTSEKTFESENSNLTFSIFLRDYDKHLSLKKEVDILDIYEAAYYYFIFLNNCCDKVYHEYCEDMFKEDLEIFKDVLEHLDLKITNKNIDRIPEISYRLYKDSKFFYELKDYLGEGTYDQFIRDFEYVISNDAEGMDFEEEVLNNVV